MEALIDEIDSLVAPDLSTSAPDWCENCQSLRKDLKKLQDEQEQSFVKLKQKIISTDLLIKKYKSKCEDYDVQFKKNEESTKRADKYQRQSEILETQLKAALMETEPLRAAKTTLESDIKLKNTEIEDLKHKLVVAESAQRQYEHLNRSTTADVEKLEAEKRELNAKIRVLESGKITKEAAKELKVEMNLIKKENTGLKRKEKQLEKKLQNAQAKIDMLTERLKENKMSPADRRRRTTSGSLLSPVRSPNRSPRTRKASPGNSPKKVAPKTSPRKSVKAEVAVMRESDSSSEESSDDDTKSVFSVKWTFSPIMPCLSPLPPSPACIRESQKKSPSRIQLSDDDNLSDMADELEQQLIGYCQPNDTDGPIEECKDEKDAPKFTAIPDIGHDNSNNVKTETSDIKAFDLEIEHGQVNVVDRNMDGHVELSRNVVKRKTADGPEDQLTKIDLSILQHDSQSLDDKGMNCDTNKMDNAMLDVDSDTKTVKERLAASIEIISPRATRKKGSHLSNDGGKNETSPGKSRKVCYQNSKYSEKFISEKYTEGNNEDNQSIENLPRNDTMEFDPMIADEVETLKQNENRSNDTVQTPYLDKIGESVVESDTKDVVNDKNIPESQMNVKKANDRPETVHKPDLSSSQGEVMEESNLEIQVDITEEVEPVKPLRKTPPLRGYLKRQQCLNRHGNSIGENSDEKKSQKPSPKCQLVVTDFQKASYGTLEEEINNLQEFSNDYTVLTRETPARANENGQIKKLKNVKKKLKSTCKFKDLDSTSNYVNKREQHHIASAFTKDKLGDLVTDIGASDNIEVQNGAKTNEKLDHSAKEFDDRMFSKGAVNEIDTIKLEFNLSRISKQDFTDTGEETSHQPASNHENTSNICDKNIDRKVEDGHTNFVQEEKCHEETENLVMDEKTILDKNSTPENVAVSAELEEVENSLETESHIAISDDKSADAPTCVMKKIDQSDNSSTISPSRQISIGFAVSPSTVERTPSVESQVSSVPFINTLGDKNKSLERTLGSPLIRQMNVHSCGTISEESEFDKDLIDDKAGESEKSDAVIFGIDDLFADNNESESSDVTSYKSGKESTETETAKTMFSSSQNRDDESKLFVNITPDQTYKLTEGLKSEISNHEQVINDGSPTEDKTKTCVTPQSGTSLSSKTNKYSDRSSNDLINQPGCSYFHDDFQNSFSRTKDSGCVTVTSTTSLTSSSSRLLTCTPDTMDSESVNVCQSQSRSTTPSICSIDMATPPLSPLSISPFEFVIPVSPLPPSPVRQVDRVSPLSPEHSTESPVNLPGEEVSNENEKNAVNVPIMMTPEKVILDKVMEHSPVPDLISPIKTPKQTNQKKRKKHKQNLSSDKKHMSSPVKFASNVPVGVLTVKPKAEVITQNPNTETSLGIDRINHVLLREMNLRKHVTLKKSADIWSRKKSVFKPSSSSDHEQKHPVNEKESDLSQNSVKEEQPLIGIKEEKKSVKLEKEGEDTVHENVEVNETGDNQAVNSAMKTEDSNYTRNVKNNVAKGKGMSNGVVDENKHSLIKDQDMNNSLNNKNINSSVKDKDSNMLLKDKNTDSSLIDRDMNSARKTKDKICSMQKKILTNSSKKKTIEMLKMTHEGDKNQPIVSNIQDKTETGDTIVTIKSESKTSKKEADVLPAGYDPLMAAKRKTRMAHQPRSQPVIVRKPPVVIEPTPKMPGTRRKRKSQETANKDVTPRKQTKGNIFQKITMDGNVDPSLQENIRKMETFLKSTEQTETFISKIHDIPAGQRLAVYMVGLCLECVGRVKSDSLDIVYHSCDNGNFLTVQDEWPFLNDVEKRAMFLLACILQNTEMGMEYQQVLQMIWERIFTKDLTVTMTGKMSLAKIFTAICLTEGDVEQPRILLYNIALCNFLHHWLFVLPIVSIWPEVLRKWSDTSLDDEHAQSMVLVFEYIVTKSLQSQGTDSSRKVLKIMETLCNWSDTPTSPESILKILITRLHDIHTDQFADPDSTFEIIKGCHLLLKDETWAWCKEHFINRQGLQTAVNRYLCARGTVSSEYVCAVLEITGSVISSHSDSIKRRDLQQICKTWLLAILSKHEGDLRVQRCCMDILLEVSSLNPTVITDLKNWFVKHPDSSLGGYLLRLETLRQAYTEKFGLVCEPFLNK